MVFVLVMVLSSLWVGCWLCMKKVGLDSVVCVIGICRWVSRLVVVVLWWILCWICL